METTAGAGSQDTVGDLEVGQGVQLVGMKHGDLEGCRGIIEDVEDGKAQVLLVGGERRVRVNKQKLRTDPEVEPVEVLPPDFAEVGLQAHLGVSLGATKEVKAQTGTQTPPRQKQEQPRESNGVVQAVELSL